MIKAEMRELKKEDIHSKLGSNRVTISAKIIYASETKEGATGLRSERHTGAGALPGLPGEHARMGG